MEFRLAIDSSVVMAETPIWDPRLMGLYWTDTLAGDVHFFDPASGRDTVYPTGEIIGSAVPCDDTEKLLVILESGIYILDKATGDKTLVADPNQGSPDTRYNDSRVDARGRIFTSTVSRLYGSPEYKPTMLGDFYMVDTDGSVKKVVKGINQYNAIVWNKDNTRMFVVDTHRQKLVAFDYDIERGPVSGPADVIDFSAQGMPDGISIDGQDHLYVCHWTGIISVWNSEMRLIDTLRFPVEYACCGGFGGADLKDFYVASSRYCYGEAELKKHPGAGGTFVGRCASAGTTDHFYRLHR